MITRRIFVTGGTGYLGRPLIERLVARNHRITALVRQASADKIPVGATMVIGNALAPRTFASAISPADTLVHLVGVRHPNPFKSHAFRTIDLKSIQASVVAACQAGIEHFVYLSVAQPAPVMQVYQQVRQEGEALIAEAGLNATFLRPWYVLGPGHHWPYLLMPIYSLLEKIPATQEGAKRLGLVHHSQMLDALVHAVEHPVRGTCILDVPAIRALSSLEPAT